VNKTFCPLPWKEISSSPSGSVRLCCSSTAGSNLSIRSDGTVAKMSDDLNKSWNTDFFKDVREKMLTGKNVSACSNCYKQEAAGIHSERLQWIEKFPDVKPENLTTKAELSEVEQLDLRLGRVCNLQCRMCGPYSSNSWEPTWKALGNLVTQPDQKTWDKLNQNNWPENPEVWEQFKLFIPKLRRVYLTGGEPFLVSKNKEFLKLCIDSGHASHIQLRYSTNGTIWDTELPSLWSHFEKVTLNFSIDGLGEVNNYIRFPARWNQLMKNLDSAKAAAQIAPIHISISTAVQAYNIFQIPELLSFFRKKELNVYLDLVHQPTYLSLGVLSPELSEKAKLKLQSELSYPGVDGLIQLLNSSKHQEWNQFIAYTKKLDEIHGQDISQVIPELGI
jgi:MoaA/NifB/PqqE/SkfB family radical SAM enzyme